MSRLVEILQNRFVSSGLSKTTIAGELDVSEKTIENYLNGKREPDLDTIIRLASILKFNLDDLNDVGEQNVPGTTINGTGNAVGKATKNDGLLNYIKLLEDNDRFFKNQYSGFNAQVLANLTALVEIGKKTEALIKLNLQHIGIVEALQKGIESDVVQEQIGNQIAGIPANGERGNEDGKNDKP